MNKTDNDNIYVNQQLEDGEVTKLANTETEDETAMAEFSINASFYANDTRSDMPPVYINNNTSANKISK